MTFLAYDENGLLFCLPIEGCTKMNGLIRLAKWKIYLKKPAGTLILRLTLNHLDRILSKSSDIRCGCG